MLKLNLMSFAHYKTFFDLAYQKLYLRHFKTKDPTAPCLQYIFTLMKQFSHYLTTLSLG